MCTAYQDTAAIALQGSVANLRSASIEMITKYLEESRYQAANERALETRILGLADPELRPALSQAIATLFSLGKTSISMGATYYGGMEKMHRMVAHLGIAWSGIVAVETETENAGEKITVHLTAVSD